ncbi:response regulator [Cyanobacteria bacterium FACHB-472]|nr:response regulator [Cyanobacteria bacterium FACHB-472]
MLRILLIDDNPDDRTLVTRQLQQEFPQLEFTSPIDAKSLDKVLQVGNFDLAIVDYELGWSNGLTLLNAIKALYPDCPVIMCTDSGSEEVAVEGMKSGLSDYVLKRKPLHRLAIAVRDTLEKQKMRREYAAAVEELQLSEERLRLALFAAQMGSWDWNILTGEVIWSEDCERLFGLAPGSFQGTYEAFLACVHPEDREVVDKGISNALSTRTNFNQEFRVVRSDGSVSWLVGRGQVLSDEKGKARRMIGVDVDISDRKQREVELRQYAEELEVANRLKDEFLAIVSHELRTPLNAILGWTQLLRSRNFDEATRKRSLEVIERNALQQNQLIEDILDTSRLMRGQMQLQISPVNLVRVIENTLNTVRLSAEAKSINFQFLILDSPLGSGDGRVEDSPVKSQSPIPINPKSDPPLIENPQFVVMGDLNRLQQVVWNLFSNAIKFTPPGGRVEVRLSLEHGEIERQKAIPSTEVQKEEGKSQKQELLSSPIPHPQSPISYARITVSDTGEGISAEFLPYAFERFRQADSTTTRSRNGLGLGLAIARQLVELHGGTIFAESKGEGQGATFIVNLPIIDARKASEPKTDNPKPKIQNSKLLDGLQVLSVDDDPDTLDLLVMILEGEGAKVTAVSCVDEALQALEKFQPDVLVSDIGMPKANGYDLIRQIRLKEKGQGDMLKAIALTAYGRQEDKIQALSAGFQMYLPKPIDPDILVNAIASLTERARG